MLSGEFNCLGLFLALGNREKPANYKIGNESKREVSVASEKVKLLYWEPREA